MLAVHLGEGLEQQVHFCSGNAAAGIGNANSESGVSRQAMIARAGLDDNGTLGSELDGVEGEVENDLAQPPAIKVEVMTDEFRDV